MGKKTGEGEREEKKDKSPNFNNKEASEYLASIYSDSKHPAGFSSFSTLYRFVRGEKNIKVSKKQVKDWLERQEVYTTNVTKKKSKHWNHRVVAPHGRYLYDVDSA